ncbi:MAG: hypothetical protein E7473_07360 [Ruminococcaceae bacterium]|nr:hypothetical protein [Oscillospiraceae bacterium]
MRMKKFMSAILAVAMLVSIMATGVYAADVVAKIGDDDYSSISDAVADADNGDVVVVVADVATGEDVVVDKSITITGGDTKPTLNNVSITANGTDVELTVSDLAFTGKSYINANNAKALTVSGVNADVVLDNADAVTNSRAAFVSLGSSELNGCPLKLTLTNNTIVVTGDNNPDPVLGWRYIADGSSVAGNTFGSEEKKNFDAVKFLNFMDGATITLFGNTVYVWGNGFAFGQNNSRASTYTAVIDDNDFVGAGADFVWIEVSGSTETNAIIKTTSENTITENGETRAFAVSDIKTNVENWTNYAGLDIVVDSEGKVVGGYLTFSSNLDVIAEGYEIDSATGAIKHPLASLDGTGTKEDPYLINDIDDLKTLRDSVNNGNAYKDKYFLLTADIDLSEEVWIPIGTSIYDKAPTDADVKMFAGNFDGGKHTITGLSSDGYIPASSETGSTEYSFGLFGYVYGANISNIKLENVDIDCGTRQDSDGNEVCGSGVAALIGYYFPEDEKISVIENCHVVSGTVKASNNMGGLIGYMDSQISQPKVDITIKDCSNAADVTAEAREAGGILGLMNSSREDNYLATMRGTIVFENCVNTGDITSLGAGSPSAAGILGRDHNQSSGQHLKIIFDGCKNSGTITVTANGETHIAGIGAGFYSHGAWLISKNCSNTGDIVVISPSTKVYAGGLISYGGVIEIIDSTSTGAVMLGDEAGNKYVGSAASILFLEGMDDYADTIGGYIYYLNGGISPEREYLVDDAANGGNFHLVETAYREGYSFEGWYDNPELAGEPYTALGSAKTYYAKWESLGVAKIDDTYFETIGAAVNAANPGEAIVIVADGTYALPSLNKNITIKAKDGVEATFDITSQVSVPATVTFENIIFDYYPNQGYVGLINNGNITYDNCTFNGQVFLYGNSEIFNSCVFNQNDPESYNVWTYAANNVEFNKCVFNSAGKSVLVYNEGDGPTDLDVVDTEFNASQEVSGKAAIEIDTSYAGMAGTEIVIDDKTSATGFATGSVSGSSLWNDKKANNDVALSGGTSSKVTVAGVVVKYAQPKGTNSPAYTKEVDGYVRVWGQSENTDASESYVLKLYSGDTLVATSVLNNVGNIIDGSQDSVTWNFYYPSSSDEYWTTTWEAGHPNCVAQPTSVELYIDGILTATTVAKMSGADDLNPVVWENLGGVLKLSGTGTEEDPYLINNLAELKLFRDIVDNVKTDASNTFKGKYVKLTDDIDLAEDVDANGDQISWNPIGENKDHGAFLGTFDGDGHTIKNLYIYEENVGYLGFFARTGSFNESEKAGIKNLKFENIDVSTSGTNHWGAHGDYVAGVVANSGGNTYIDGVEITGDVYIVGCGYVGGIVGHGYPRMSNCSVEANGGSYIHSHYWSVGALVGYAGEGTTVSDSYVDGNANISDGDDNLSVWGAYGAQGAAIGLANDNGSQFCTLTNVTAKNVDVSGSDYVSGLLAGNSECSKLIGCYVENVTFNGNATDAGVVASVDGKVYYSIEDALNAIAADGTIVTLVNDMTVDTGVNAISYTNPYSFILDFDGHTLNANTTNAGIRININNDEVTAPVEVTIKNGTVNAGSTAYCALVATGKSKDIKLTVNLEDMTMTNCHDYGFNVKAFANAIVNVKTGTEIISTNGQGGVYATDDSVVNVYSGAKITQTGSTTTYMGANVAASGTGVANVYGGTFKSDKYNALVMSSGGTINIYDGTMKSDQKSIEVDSWDTTIVAPSVANVYGGSFTAPTVVWVGAYENVSSAAGEGTTTTYSATANLYGGIFNGTLDESYGGDSSNINAYGGVYNEDPTAYIATLGYTAHSSNNMWVVAPEYVIEAVASKPSVQAGEKFTVSIKINGGDYTNAGWKLSYDATKFEYVSGDNGQTQSNFAIVDSVLGEGDGIDGDEFEDGEVIATYTFQALYPAEPVTGTFTLSDAYVDNYEMAAWLDKVPAGVINEDVTITNDRTELTVTCANKTVDYNGKAQQGNPAVPNMTAEVTYSKVANGTYTTEVPSFIDVGEHTYYYKVTRPGYTDVIGSAKLTITAVDLTVGATFNVDPDFDKVTIQAVLSNLVDGSFEGTVTVEVDGKTVTFNAADFTYDGDGDAISRESDVITLSKGGVHNVTITYTPATKDNYNTATGTTTVNADRKSVTAADLAAINDALTTSFAYDGTEKKVVVNENALPDGWEITVPNVTLTDVGETMVTLSATDTAEKYADFTFNVVLSVTPKKIAIVINNAEKALGQEDPVFTSNIASLLVNADDLGNIEYVREPGEAMGEYFVTLNYTPNQNYEIVSITKGILTIGDVADYVVEVADNSLIKGGDYKADYIAGHRLVLVYTNVDKAYFTYNGEAMYDVSDAGYEYYEYDYNALTATKGTTTYKHVYAIVVEADGVYEATEEHELKYRRNVKFDKDADKPVKIVYDSDINYTGELDENDFSQANGIYNALYRGSNYITRFLKADTNADKRVDNIYDAASVKADVVK